MSNSTMKLKPKCAASHMKLKYLQNPDGVGQRGFCGLAGLRVGIGQSLFRIRGTLKRPQRRIGEQP